MKTKQEHHGWPHGDGKAATFVRENALGFAAFFLFLLSLAGQALTGHHQWNEEAAEHGRSALSFGAYLTSGAFGEALFENWESEFLQMALFVVLTKFLRQKGSAESKSLADKEAVDDDPKGARHDPDAPWPVRRGGLALAIYSRSLSIALFLLFAGSFVMHAYSGARHYSEEQLRHGGESVSTFAYMGTSQFWFESFQNWQSEFVSIFALIVLSVFLRERGSPQSKPVAAPHDATAS
jgi:hypothetical protein